MQHIAAAQHGSSERIGPRPFVRVPASDVGGLPRAPRRLPARLRGRTPLVVPPD